MSVGGYKTFGDSISDAGNLYKTPNGPLPPYYHGHFSNGPTWVEDLSQLLGLGTLAPSHSGGADYAVGGARTSDLSAEIDTYAGAHPKPVANALYTLDSGGGDIVDALGDYEADKISLAEAGTRLVQAETNTVDAIESLFRLGARNLLFYEVPNLGLFPPFRGTPQQSLASNAAA